jgi:hypothetical protein
MDDTPQSPHGGRRKLKKLLDANQYVAQRFGPSGYALAFAGRLRDWQVRAHINNGWLALTTYVMALPESPGLRATFTERLLELNDVMSVAKFTKSGNVVTLVWNIVRSTSTRPCWAICLACFNHWPTSTIPSCSALLPATRRSRTCNRRSSVPAKPRKPNSVGQYDAKGNVVPRVQLPLDARPGGFAFVAMSEMPNRSNGANPTESVHVRAHVQSSRHDTGKRELMGRVHAPRQRRDSRSYRGDAGSCSSSGATHRVVHAVQLFRIPVSRGELAPPDSNEGVENRNAVQSRQRGSAYAVKWPS